MVCGEQFEGHVWYKTGSEPPKVKANAIFIKLKVKYKKSCAGKGALSVRMQTELSSACGGVTPYSKP